MTWLEYRGDYLQELLRVRGRALRNVVVCARCNESDPMYRCEDCFDKALLCSTCCISEHQKHPLHRIEVRVHLSHMGILLT